MSFILNLESCSMYYISMTLCLSCSDMKRQILLLLLALSSLGRAQDTLSVYFDVGKSRINEDQMPVLNSMLDMYDMSSLDSVFFIGMADSVGKMKSNLKLSLKRAEEVLSYCKTIIDPSVPYQVRAEGEKTLQERYLNRRVDVILFFHPVEEVEEEKPEDKFCYRIAYGMLRGANIRTITKRKREYVQIEYEWDEFFKELRTMYTGSVNSKGEFVARKINWKNTKTGSLWWKRKRLVATIDKDDFEQFSIFMKIKEPCTKCDEHFDSIQEIRKMDTCQQIDPLVMSKLQYRYPLFKTENVKVRVPREFVDTSINYFIYKDGDSHKVMWDVHSGKKRKHYFYTTLPVVDDKIVKIERFYPCSKFERCYDSEPYKLLDYCLGCISYPTAWFKFNIETGAHYQFREIVPYGAIGMTYNRQLTDYELFVGLHTKGTLYCSGRMRYNFFSFQLSDLKQENTWQHIKERPLNKKYWIGRLYIGTELKTSLGKEDYQYFECNAHGGISFLRARSNFPERIFLQGGIGYDFFNSNNVRPYGILQIGVCFNVWNSM